MSKRFLLAIVSGLIVFTSAFAFAASLGTINTGSVGASDAVVGSCDTDGVSTAYTTAWNTNRYVVTHVQVSGIASACNGLTMRVSATGGAEPGHGSITVAGTSGSVALSPAVEAKDFTGVHVVIGS